MEPTYTIVLIYNQDTPGRVLALYTDSMLWETARFQATTESKVVKSYQNWQLSTYASTSVIHISRVILLPELLILLPTLGSEFFWPGERSERGVIVDELLQLVPGPFVALVDAVHADAVC